MATPGHNEGLRVLDDFVCEAAQAEDAVRPVAAGRRFNPGMDMLTEVVCRAPRPPISAARVAELRSLSTPQLLSLVRRSGAELDGQELLVIHDIAAERLGRDGPPFVDGAVELSREVMLSAVNRHAETNAAS